tara:strand:- start:108 stop:956 length:849 start_codon:yes stop_codon:yes gene_type:complete
MNSKYNFIENNLVVFLYLILRAIIIFGHITYNFGRVIFGRTYVKMLLENLLEFQDKKNLINQNNLNHKKISNYDLKVENLAIGYEEIILNNINFNIKEGEFCLVSGNSGIGKSALLLTLTGIISSKSGSIKWGSNNLDEIDLSNFRKNISYCTTEPYLIEGTVSENILYGIHDKISNQEIEDALKICHCEFLKKQGVYSLNYQIKDDGSGLSAGQKQRIALARAILNKPRLIILDEATVNIDELLEEKIILNIKKFLPKTVYLAVSHRKSLKKHADKIINLE